MRDKLSATELHPQPIVLFYEQGSGVTCKLSAHCIVKALTRSLQVGRVEQRPTLKEAHRRCPVAACEMDAAVSGKCHLSQSLSCCLSGLPSAFVLTFILKPNFKFPFQKFLIYFLYVFPPFAPILDYRLPSLNRSILFFFIFHFYYYMLAVDTDYIHCGELVHVHNTSQIPSPFSSTTFLQNYKNFLANISFMYLSCKFSQC